MSVLPRHLCTSFWTTTQVTSDLVFHAQVLFATTVQPIKNKVFQLSVKTAVCPVGTYMYTDENRCLECPAGNENEHLFRR